ncbi:hypothetical protein F511_18371 [Dorcoceras hygrometricum]|uniref:Uncharacterized protein n=1 Tax=Dorcoceras hygrometricum TaxID=472368 RepID=A0A2Z7C9J0_9LAMI|nr:hypothetical protein F511_18371 [Dorcoceras hygrometricum]
MVFILIGIYVLKGPYCTLTTTNWFLQALSVIPRGSWGRCSGTFHDPMEVSAGDSFDDVMLCVGIVVADLATAALTWISAGERYRISKRLYCRQSMGVIALIVCLLVVNAGQPSCSARRIRRRLVSARSFSRCRGSLIVENASTIAPAGFVGGNALLLVAAACYLAGTCAWLQPVFQEPGSSRYIAVVTPIRSTTRSETPSSGCTRSPDEISTNGFSTSSWPETNFPAKTAAAHDGGGDGVREEKRGGGGQGLESRVRL